MRLPFFQKRAQGFVGFLPVAGQTPVSPPRNYRTFALEGFSRNPLVYACIAARAQSASQIRLHAQQLIGRDWVSAPDTSQRTPEADELQQLLDNPNPRQSQTQWLSDTIACRDVAGNSYTQIELSRSGRPVHLWHLPRPEFMQVVPDPQKLIGGYVYNPGDGGKGLAPEEVIHFRHLPDPLNPLLGLSPIAVVARELDADNAATDFLKQFFDKGGVPMFAALFKGTVTEPEAQKFQAAWQRQFSLNQGGNATGGVFVGEANEIELQKLGSTTGSKEMGLLEIRQVIEARVCSVFRMHPQIVFSMLGFLHPTYAQARMAESVTWEMGYCPMYTSLADDTTIAVKPYFPNCRVVADFSQVAALAEDEDALWARHMHAFEIGLETDEEARQALKLAKNPTGRRFLPYNRVQLTPDGDMAPRVTATEQVPLTPEQLQEQESGKPVTGGPPAAATETVAPPPGKALRLPAGAADGVSGENAGTGAGNEVTRKGARQAAGQPRQYKISERAQRHAARMEKLRTRIAADTAPRLADYFAGLAERVVHRLSAQDGKAIALLRQHKADAPYPFDAHDLLPASEDRSLAAILSPLWTQAMEDGWDLTASEFELEAAFSVTNPDVERLLRTASSERVKDITDATRTALREALAEGAKRGYSVRQLARGVADDDFAGVKDLIEQTYEGRADTISRTESMWASNMGSVALYRSENVGQVEMLDGDYDEVCAARNGQIVSIDEGEVQVGEEHPNGQLVLAPVAAGSEA